MSVGEKSQLGRELQLGWLTSEALFFTGAENSTLDGLHFKVLNFENSAPMPTVVKVCQVTRVQNWGFTS